MTEFVSEVKTIPFNEDRIFNMLSDLSNLGKVQDRIPQDKIQDFEFDKDSCSFSVAPVGKITFQICLLYTSDAADDLTRVDLGGRRIIKKKKKIF